MEMGRGRMVAALAAALAIAGCQTSANSHWEQIGYGPTYEYANAQCSIMSSSTQQGMVAWGTPSYVAGAQLGNALGNAIRQAEFMKNCMVMQGWKQVPNAKVAAAKITPATAATTNYNRPRSNPAMSAIMLDWGSANNRCLAGDTTSCSRRTILEKELAKMGVSPT
ncbi:hypothetical protein NKJ72_11690 [Mesorhizobium sp. M0045]|uniref:hypothetical protein n=1 Tax=unclassified Mesorhizobium TaxID=325217 RepID=UPI00333DE1DE